MGPHHGSSFKSDSIVLGPHGGKKIGVPAKDGAPFYIAPSGNSRTSLKGGFGVQGHGIRGIHLEVGSYAGASHTLDLEVGHSLLNNTDITQRGEFVSRLAQNGSQATIGLHLDGPAVGGSEHQAPVLGDGSRNTGLKALLIDSVC